MPRHVFLARADKKRSSLLPTTTSFAFHKSNSVDVCEFDRREQLTAPVDECSCFRTMGGLIYVFASTAARPQTIRFRDSLIISPTAIAFYALKSNVMYTLLAGNEVTAINHSEA